MTHGDPGQHDRTTGEPQALQPPASGGRRWTRARRSPLPAGPAGRSPRWESRRLRSASSMEPTESRSPTPNASATTPAPSSAPTPGRTPPAACEPTPHRRNVDLGRGSVSAITGVNDECGGCSRRRRERDSRKAPPSQLKACATRHDANWRSPPRQWRPADKGFRGQRLT